MIKQPFDTPILKKLNGVLQFLKADKQKGVAQIATETEAIVLSIEANFGMESAEDVLDKQKEQEEDELVMIEEKETEEMRKKEEEARSEFRRKLAEKEQEISMKNRIFGTRRQKQPSVTGVALEPLYDKGIPKKDAVPRAATKSEPKKSSSHINVGKKKDESVPVITQKPSTKQDSSAIYPLDPKKGAISTLMSNLKVDSKTDVSALLSKDVQRKALPALNTPMPAVATMPGPTSPTSGSAPLTRPNSGGKIVLSALPKKTSPSIPFTV